MRTSPPRRLARTSLVAVLAVTALLPLPALAHGSVDQVHDGTDADSACSAAEYPGTVLITAGSESRQSFVPSRGGLGAVELCVETVLGVTGDDFTVAVYEGDNPAAPGPRIGRQGHDIGADILTSQWVHVDFATDVPTTGGASYVLGIRPTAGVVGSVEFRWRATCVDDLLSSCDGVADSYPKGSTNDLPANADYGFRTLPTHTADLVPRVTIDPVVCPGLDLTHRATGEVTNTGLTSVAPFDAQWVWSADPVLDDADEAITGGRHRIDGLAAGATATVPPPTLPAGLDRGDGHLLLHADVDDEVVESDEQANVAAGPTTVTACGQPRFEQLDMAIDEDQVLTGFHERQFTDLDPAALATLPQSVQEALAGPAANGSGFSPTGFSPTGFSPNGFSANGFSPTGFSPSGFSPTGFSPSGFSPSGFSPSGFSPSGFSPAGTTLLRTVLADLPADLPERILVVDVPIAGPGWGERLPGDRPIQDYTLGAASALLPDLTLSEVDLSAVFGMSWLGLALSGGSLDDTPLPDGRSWCDLLAQYGSDCAATGVDPARTSLLGLEATGFPSFQAPIAAQPLSSIDLAAPFLVRDLSLDPQVDASRFSLEHTRLGQLAADLALTDPSVAFDCENHDCGQPLATLAAAGAARDVNVGTLLDALSPAGQAGGVVGDLGLGTASLDTLNLAAANWNLANPYRVDPACSPVTYRVGGRNTGEGPSIDPTATATLAPGFAMVPGTTALTVDGAPGPAQGEPSVVVAADGARTYTFPLHAEIDEHFELSFQACAGVYLGSVDAGSATISGTGVDGAYSGSSRGAAVDSVRVVERTPGVSTHHLTSEDNVVLFDHIDQSDEHDSATFQVKVEPGILYEVNLFVPPGAAFDLLAFGPESSAIGFNPTGFSPTGFSPSGFSPTGFSANGFSPSGFSPSGFSPTGFSANGFSPTLPSEVLDDLPLAELAPPGSTGTYASANRGDQVETLYLLGNHGDAGVFTFSVVDDASRSSAPYVLTVQTRRPQRNPKLDVCQAAPWDLLQRPGAAPATWTGTEPPRTVFLVNRQVTASAHGADAAEQGIGALHTLAARPEVAGIVVEVDHDPDVRAAYGAWRDDWCNPTAANAVATHVRSQVLRLRAQHPTIDTVVVAGGDPIIPDFRLPDHLWTGNEQQYVDTLLRAVPANNATIAAFAERTLLSLDPYGNEHPASFGPTLAFPPSAGVSRLVESPDEWVRQVDQYGTADGLLAPQTALVTGYDGFTDGAEAARDVLEGGGVPTRLLTDGATPWVADDLRQAAFDEAPALGAINAHTNHWAILSSQGSHAADETDIVSSAEAGRLPLGVHVLSNGCHLGTAVDDVLNRVPDGDQSTRLEDWAQAVGRRQGVAVANTGFGIFDTEVVEQGERLQAMYLEELQHARNASLALARAKQRYLATVGVHDAFAYKTLHQLTMYGPGTYALAGAVERPVEATPAPTSSIPVDTGPYTVEQEASSCERCLLLGQSENGTEVSLRDPGAETGHTAVSGYWSAPRSSRAVRRPAGTLSAGLWITEVESVTLTDLDPVITRLAKNRPDRETETQVAAPFPTTFAQVADVGPDAHVTLMHGIAQPTRKSDGTVRADVHLYTRLAGDLLLRPDTTVGCRPHISGVDLAAADGAPLVVVDVTVSEHCGPNQRVGVVARDDAGGWHVRDLALGPDGSWSGAVTLSPGATAVDDLLVQASNGLGVGHWRNNGDRPLVRTEVQRGVDVAFEGPSHASGVYTGPVTGTILGTPGVRYDVLLDDQHVGSLGTGQSFPVQGDGVHQVEVLGSDGSLYGVVLAIDGSAPTIGWRSPSDGQVVRSGDPLPVDVSCTDTGTGADCAISVDGTSIANGAALPTDRIGTYTVTVVASDAVGHTADDTRTYTVESRYETTGFESPIAPKPTVNSVGAGKTVPVKFTVTSGGQPVSDVGIISARLWQPVDCASKASVGEPLVAAGSNPEYSGFFHFNVTAPSTIGCYELVVELDDGLRLTAWFRVG